MNENIINAICIAFVCTNAIWAYAFYCIRNRVKTVRKVDGATAEVLANRIAELTKRIDSIQNEVDHMKVDPLRGMWRFEERTTPTEGDAK